MASDEVAGKEKNKKKEKMKLENRKPEVKRLRRGYRGRGEK
jgi:hypothetical protein